MGKETLLRLTTKQLNLELRGQCKTDAEPTELQVQCADEISGDHHVPMLDQQRLQIVIRAARTVSVAPVLEDAVQNDAGTFLTGYLNFDETVGLTDVTILLENEVYLRFPLEICPACPTYRKDHAGMVTELQQNLAQLAVAAIRREEPDYLPDGWQEEQVRADLEKTCCRLVETADRIFDEHLEKPALRLLKRRAAYDTPENRLLKHVLRSAGRCLRAADAADAQIGALHNRAAKEELEHVGAYNSAEQTRPDAMDPVYQILYQCYRRIVYSAALLQLRVSFALEQISQLYRYWAFFRIAATLLERYPLVGQNVLTWGKHGAALPFLEAQPVYIDFGGADGCRSVRLSLASDGLIYLQKSGDVPSVFAACYCSESDLAESRNRRNALYYRYRTGSPGAFVLFAGKDDPDYRQSEAYRAIAREHVGAIPMLHGNTALMERLLDKLLCGMPMLDYEPVTLPTELEMALEQVDWSKRNVLVGAMRNPEQLETCLKRRFYHIPANLVDQSSHPIGYVALYQSRNLFGRDAGIWHYGEVAEYNAVPRYTIKELPSYSKETYYRFAIKQWNKLPQGIQVRDAGSIAKMTNLFLLQNSSTDTELLIANEEMFRLQYALRQALAAYGDGQTEVGFALADCQIAVCQGEIHVYRDRALCGAVSLAAWQKRPRQALEQLYGYIFPKETDKA